MSGTNGNPGGPDARALASAADAGALVRAVRAHDPAAVAEVLGRRHLDLTAIAVVLAASVGKVTDPLLPYLEGDPRRRCRPCLICHRTSQRRLCQACSGNEPGGEFDLGGVWLPNGRGTLDWHPTASAVA